MLDAMIKAVRLPKGVGQALLIYDGDCGFCTKTIRWVERQDRNHRIRCITSQEPDAAAALTSLGLSGVDEDTVIFVQSGKAALRSTAGVWVLRLLGPGWWIVGNLLWIVPRPICDAVYNLIARNRHVISPSCNI